MALKANENVMKMRIMYLRRDLFADNVLGVTTKITYFLEIWLCK